MQRTIFKIAIPSPLQQTFDYLPPVNCAININSNTLVGARVLVPFGRREAVGFVLEITDTSDISPDKLKPITKLLDEEPLLTPSIINLVKWISSYYHHPLGEVFAKTFPPILRSHKKLYQKKVLKNQLVTKNEIKPTPIEPKIDLNDQQKQAIFAIIEHNGFGTFLLDGVTGSGKTEVYLQVIKHIIDAGKQALVLVPEINLTPQTIARFADRFPVNIAVLHSKLAGVEKLHSWFAAKDGLAPIVIGTRSAVFTPLPNPGIIILDEEHDLSFKQQSDLRYSARDVAIMRGKLENIPVILGSATPSLESIHNTKRGRFIKLTLTKRAGTAVQPSFSLVDMRSQKLKDGFAPKLTQAIEKHLEQQGQVLIFLNRRGYAPVMLCHKCGYIVDCKNCDAHMTMHRATQKLHCHHCDYSTPIPNTCPKCATKELLPVGLGTERIEISLKKLFPGASVIRIDSDTTRRKGSINKLLGEITEGKNQILVGTKMLAKGHHFPNVTMVGILDADNGLFSPDFRANEHLAQLIIQVAGRAGREKRPGEVYIQTYNPDHPLLLNLTNNGYHSFTGVNLAERKKAQLPPFTYLALFRGSSMNKEKVEEFLQRLKNFGEKIIAENTDMLAKGKMKILGPTSSPMERKANHYQMQLMLQSHSRSFLHMLLNQIIAYITANKPSRSVKWSLDVDPLEIFS